MFVESTLVALLDAKGINAFVGVCPKGVDKPYVNIHRLNTTETPAFGGYLDVVKSRFQFNVVAKDEVAARTLADTVKRALPLHGDGEDLLSIIKVGDRVLNRSRFNSDAVVQMDFNVNYKETSA